MTSDKSSQHQHTSNTALTEQSDVYLPGDAAVLASLTLGRAAATPVAPTGLFLGGDVPLGPAICTRYVVVVAEVEVLGPSCISLDVFALNCFLTWALCALSLTGEEP